MKFNIDIKNKKAGIEADVEHLVEKGMDQHDKNWKDKFSTKHIAKKEIMELKHKQKMEIEEKNQNKKNWIQQIQEEKRKIRELEIEEQKRLEKEHKKILKIKIITSILLGIVGIVLFSIGNILGSNSRNPNSGWYAMGVMGIFPLFAIAFVWIDNSNQKKK